MDGAIDLSTPASGPRPRAEIRHHIPGRTRVGMLESLPDSGRERLAQALARRGWRLSGFNSVTRSVLVLHARTSSAEEVMDAVLQMLDERSPAKPAAQAPRPDAATAALMAAAPEDALAQLGSGRQGLGEAEAAARLERCGPNGLPRPERRARTAIVAAQLNTLPVALLAGSAVLSLATGGLFDAAVTIVVVALNAGIGFYTENAVEALIARLGQPIEHVTVVVREGRARPAPARDIVPGDLVALAPGQIVPADGRLIAATDLTIDESILTGESLGVDKISAPLEGELPLAERANMVHAGTVVVGGQGLAVIARTGLDTETAQVRSLIASARPPEPLIKARLDELSRTLVYGALAASGLVLGIGLVRGRPMADMIRSAISLAVASLPEGLPAVATTTFALEAKAMERRGVFVRMLPAIESIGAIDTLCLDKTGTLTENRMTVAGAAAGSAVYAVDDAGRLIRADGAEAVEKDRRALAALAEAVALCNTAENHGAGRGEGSGTELALLDFAALAGIEVETVRQAAPRLAARERTLRRRYMSTLHERDGEMLLFLKGAPEEVLPLCGFERRTRGRIPLDQPRRAEILAQNAVLAGRGQRVLGVARLRSRAGAFDPEAPEGLEWLGLVGLGDPLRSTARRAIATFQSAGVRTLMITGDHAITARAVAESLDLAAGGGIEVLTGPEMAAMDDAALAQAARRTTVFARATPADKLRIVRALQGSGAVVGVLGDGVNDGPALREARVGIAMGAKGSDVAREVADVVIAGDDLAALASAVARGRGVDDNIRNAVRFLLSTNLSEILVMLAESFGTPQELETPMELFWLNLVTDVLPALGLAMAEPAGDVMSRPPQVLQGPILPRGEYARLGLDGAQIAAAALAAHLAARGAAGPGPRTRASTFLTLAGAQLAHAFSLRDRSRGDPRGRAMSERRLELSVAGGLGLLALPFVWPGLGRALGASRPSGRDLGLSAGLIAASFAASELRARPRPRVCRP
jgi:Ca2+-transporting ATPase